MASRKQMTAAQVAARDEVVAHARAWRDLEVETQRLALAYMERGVFAPMGEKGGVLDSYAQDTHERRRKLLDAVTRLEQANLAAADEMARRNARASRATRRR